METMVQDIGDDHDKTFAPASTVTCLAFGCEFLENEAAVKWTSARLVKGKPKCDTAQFF